VKRTKAHSYVALSTDVVRCEGVGNRTETSGGLRCVHLVAALELKCAFRQALHSEVT
jgi:hypothetical protein